MRETTSFSCKALMHTVNQSIIWHINNLVTPCMNELYNPVGMLMHTRSPVAVLWLAQIGYTTATWKSYNSIHAKITLLYIVVFSTSSIH